MVWKLIHYQNYKVNRKGTVVRVKPAAGTWPGRVLSPYSQAGAKDQYVKLCHEGVCRQFKVSSLVKRAFKKS